MRTAQKKKIMDEGKETLEGFNAGYIIEKHRPSLAKQLTKAVDLPFVEGFIAGSEEYSKERIQVKTIAKLREASKGSIPFPTKDKARDDKGKGFEIDR